MKSSLPVIYNCIIIIERKVVFPNLALVWCDHLFRELFGEVIHFLV